ncbi:MAG: iron ABC transporter substrate-binding protein [Gaiellaceae bacterium]
MNWGALTRWLVALAAVVVAGCGGGSDETLTVYSGREEELVAPLFELFTEESGIEVEVRYGDSAELAATIAEEGENSPADVFWAQDPGSLGAVEDELDPLSDGILGLVPERFRDSDGRWIGTSGRSRVIVYNTDALSEEDVPDSVFDLTGPRWKGRIGIAPTNASFQAFVTAMRLAQGDDVARQWLLDLQKNDPKEYEKNTPVVEAVASGEVDVGLVNHYYLYLVQEEQPDAPIANHFLEAGDPGALVSVAGVGVLETAGNASAAERFVEFLLSQ